MQICMNIMVDYLILIAGWIAYFAVHSGMAMSSVKQRFGFRGYRVVYVLISVAGLLGLLFFSDSIPAEVFFVSEGPPRYVSVLLITAGVMVIQSTFKQYSFKGFVGLAQEKSGLKTEGILSQVRHPIYSGTALVILGFFLFIPNLPTLVSCLCMLIYIPIGIMLEEKKLVALYGDAYIKYRASVPAIIPKL